MPIKNIKNRFAISIIRPAGVLAIVLLLFFPARSVFADGPPVQWEKTFGGSNSDYGRSVQETSHGGYIITGATYNDYGTSDNDYGTSDVYLIKTDSTGNKQWQNTFGGGGQDWGMSVQQTTDGGFIITGATSSFGNWGNVYLIKTDSSGNMQWQKTFGGSKGDCGYSVQQTADNGYIITGVIKRSIYYGDICLIKTDSKGNLQWQKTFGGPWDNQGHSVRQTMDGGYIIAGEIEGGNGLEDVYLIKTDSAGNLQWQRTFGGYSSFERGMSVQQTSDGGFIIAGMFGAYLIKTDSAGNPQWQKTFGGSYSEYGSSVQQTTDGGYIIAGYTWSFGAGDTDVYLIKTDSAGSLQWQKTFRGVYDDYGYSVQQTSDGGYIIAGDTWSFGAGRCDVYLIKLAPDFSIGTIEGVVQDSQTGLAIEGAEVFVASMPYLTAESDATGHYQIVGVPYNTLFTLVASASGYETSYTNGVQVTETNPFKTVDIDLTPSPWQSLKLIELNPNPNADPMEIMQGGIGHRYYQVVDEGNMAHNGISVATSPPLHGPFYSSRTIREGVVSIDVNSLEVTDGQTITITHLNNVALESGQQKSFTVSISPREQEKVWELQTAADLSISNFTGETEGSLEIGLSDNQGNDGIPDVISISRKALLGGGVSASVGVAAYCRVANFSAGGRAQIGGSVTAGRFVRDQFGYSYNTDDFVENLAKLDLLLYPGASLHPVLVIIQGGLEVVLLPNYREELEAGYYIKGAGNAQADLTVPVLVVPVSFGIDAEAELEAMLLGSAVWRKDSTISAIIEYNSELYGRLEAGAGIDLGLVQASVVPLARLSAGVANKVRFELVCDTNQKILKKIKVAINIDTEIGNLPYESWNGQEIEWTIEGPPQSLERLITPLGILYTLVEAVGATEPHTVEISEAGIVRELNNIFLNAQRNLELVITYERKVLRAQVIDSPIFELDLGAEVLVKGSVGAGLEVKFSETRELVIERGRIRGISAFPTESYSENIYDPININLADVYTKALTDVGGPVLQSIFNYVEHTVQAGQEIIVNAANSVLQIGTGVLDAGQKIFNVFEAQFGQEMMALAADSNMPLENKYFGIGGTYRLEPADLNLPTPATFTISYSDSDVGSKDESSFRMYRWNDSTGKWEFIGGTVDIINNTVTASIVRFGTYAIGARVEYGHFTFDVEPNAAPSDGNSIITFASEIVKNNDGTQVTDGTSFTLATSGGTITTPDVNNSLEGIQIVTNSGILEFTLKAPQIGMKVRAEAASLSRLAVVTGDANFVDSNAPQPPTGLQAQIVNGKVLLSWNANSEIDLAGYKIYFDDDQSGPPYEGAAYYSGQNSPVDVADANSHTLRGLQSSHTYYVSLTAYDVPGNESQFGSEVVFVNTLPADSDSDGMPDSWEVKYANAANGLLPTADDSMLDNDGDGLPNSEEYRTDNDPLNPDSDEDGVEDGADMCQTNTHPGLSVDANGCAVGDFDSDGRIGLTDLSRILAHWLDADCSEPDWCEGTDFDLSTNVNFTDFSDFARAWSIELLEPVMGDFNRNRIVDMEDVAVFAGQWLQICTGPSWCDRCDIDKSSFVDFADFTQSAEHWLEGI